MNKIYDAVKWNNCGFQCCFTINLNNNGYVVSDKDFVIHDLSVWVQNKTQYKFDKFSLCESKVNANNCDLTIQLYAGEWMRGWKAGLKEIQKVFRPLGSCMAAIFQVEKDFIKPKMDNINSNEERQTISFNKD